MGDVKPGIIAAVLAGLQESLGKDYADLRLEQAVIGLFFTGVKLSNQTGGMCFTPIKSIPEAVCCPSSARVMPNPGALRGKSVASLLAESGQGSPIKKALAIAVINALSTTCRQISPPDYIIRYGRDPLDDFPIPEQAQVTVVGALVPYIRLLKKRGKPFAILELDPRTLKPDELPYYVPPEQAAEVVGATDLLIITGTTLLNDSLETILAMKKPEAGAVVVGPTAGMLPGPLFQRGVTRLGGIEVTKPDETLAVLSEGGSGYHLFGKSVERTVIEPAY
ncbi:MAG: DUF364 domain-containing protein [Heliobacteriaceae bacterium]|nr:DUF364 domain-containing protein [Heliobacteriaceae bacterium]